MAQFAARTGLSKVVDVTADYSGHFELYQALIPYYRHRPDDCLFLAHANGHGHPGTVEELALTWIIRQLDRHHGTANVGA